MEIHLHVNHILKSKKTEKSWEFISFEINNTGKILGLKKYVRLFNERLAVLQFTFFFSFLKKKFFFAWEAHACLKLRERVSCRHCFTCFPDAI